MPSPYVLKTSPIDSNRLKKTCKKLIEEADDDRSLALETHRFFREMLAENPQDASAKSLMVDCLKLAQTSKTSTLKVIDLLIKLETSLTKGDASPESDSLHAQLERLANKK